MNRVKNEPLFDPSIPTLEKGYTDKDLRELYALYSDYNIHYFAICARPDYLPVKHFLEDGWTGFKDIADRNFIQQISTTSFYAKLWELFLYKVLSDQGLVAVPTGGWGPDLKIPLGDRTLWIEAVTAGKGENENAVETFTDQLSKVPAGTIISRSGSFDEINHPKLRRITSALKEKLTKYEDKYKDLIAPNDYFIIAISGAEIEGEMMDKGLLLQLVGGIDLAIHFPRLPDGTFGDPYHTTRTSIPNALDTQTIPQGWFALPGTKELSGVIFCGQSPADAIFQNSYNIRTLLAHNSNAVVEKQLPIELLNFFTQVVQIPTGWDTVPSTYYKED